MKGGIFHGGRLDDAIARYGGEPGDWLDLSTGINPEAWPLPELPAQCWTRLPDRAARSRLEAAAREYFAIPEHLAIAVAPGTQALIELLPRFLPEGPAAILRTEHGVYGEHAHCCAKAGRPVDEILSPAGLRDSHRLAILVNPNNPDGHVWPRSDIDFMARRLGDGYLIIDEAFCDAVPQVSILPDPPGNVIVLRSFGKFFGLAGLRLGFAFSTPNIAASIERWLGPWAVPGPALEIGAQALLDREWIVAMRRRLGENSAMLADLLADAGLHIAGRNPLFVLARHDDAAAIHEELLHRRILVRAFADRPDLLRFGLPAGEAQFSRLAKALTQEI